MQPEVDLLISRRFSWLALTLSLARVAAAQGLQGDVNPALDHAVRSFWEAGNDKDARSAAAAVLAAGAGPDTVWRRMAGGRIYSARVPKGRLNLEHQTPDRKKHRYVLVVPSTYDPAVPMPLRIYLHGGVDTEDRNSARLWDFDRFGPGEGLALYPSAWRGAPWWHLNQMDNILGIIAELKHTYNIDENRIHIVGVSDGGTGAYFLAFKTPTAFAGFAPLIGHAGALVNPRLGAAGPFYVRNLRNSPFFIVNGALDPLYPVREVAPYVALYRQAGVNLVFRPRSEAGHDLRWWPEVQPAVDSFIRQTRRSPFPDRISWESDSPDRFSRVFWLRIDSIGPVPGEAPLPSLDSIVPLRPEPSLGVRADPASTQGVRLLAVELGSTAGQAGLLAGDRIVEANGTPTPTVASFLQATLGLSWGDSLVLLVDREDARGRITVQFGPDPGSETNARILAFPRPRPTGQVELERKGNTVEVLSSGVRRFTLLLSPAQFNLDQVITVRVNGKVVFQGTVPRKVETLLEWALEDRDRTMLYLASLTIDLPAPGARP
jgi:acetyl esterase/lipase